MHLGMRLWLFQVLIAPAAPATCLSFRCLVISASQLWSTFASASTNPTISLSTVLSPKLYAAGALLAYWTISTGRPASAFRVDWFEEASRISTLSLAFG